MKKNYLSSILWGISIFSFSFQCYIPQLSGLIVPFLLLFMFSEIPNMKFNLFNKWLQLFGVYTVYLCISFLSGIYKGYEISRGMRFFAILFFIPVAQLIFEKEFKLEWIIFKLIMSMKSISVLIIWIQVFLSQNYENWRYWIRQRGGGDIYISNGLTKVQLAGNSLFLMGLILNGKKKKKIDIFGVLMLLGLLASGNSAYILGLVLFLISNYCSILKNKKSVSYKKILFSSIIAFLISVIFIDYAYKQLKIKAEYSNAIRVEEAQVLLSANLLTGRGLGAKIDRNTISRYNAIHMYDYVDSMYFELQTFYIFYQIGILGLIPFYMLTIVPYIKKEKKKQLIAYFIYLCYTFWNPYCFDSTHIITLILINNVFMLYEKRDEQFVLMEYDINAGEG